MKDVAAVFHASLQVGAINLRKAMAELFLNHVEHEVVSAVEPSVARIEIMPLLVVNGDSHFRRVAMVETIIATEILLPVEVLGIVDIWVVIETIPITKIGLSSPRATVGLLFRGRRFCSNCVAAEQHSGNQ